MLNQLWNDEAGFVISAELVLVLTIAVLAMIVGLSEVAVAVNTELNDISNAIGALNQSYAYTGFVGSGLGGGKSKSYYAGSRFEDATDDCDLNTTCDLVTGTTDVTASESTTP
ncbi:MAG: hypothetical protein CME31_23390 [Gimesia sp.]|jgi:Flp pilus assembly pilin Flp|uniref:Branched-chain amino acid aminotransferase n=1 Tax=Gimesia maris TaxID=122 RepID=A0A3D3RA43_9PLAN|nr:hypothetical protein [Gimesia sp.]HCO25713.1 hypothetical protein [Gimesia maris]|tara:strand:- start:19221 stop:19559 length:339 start_codon:yes stop_codon:yes gene_type:complete